MSPDAPNPTQTSAHLLAPDGLRPRHTRRGRPQTSGRFQCARCRRAAGKLRAHWPEGGICGICFTTAMRTTGTCPGCGVHRLLPGPPTPPGGPRCADCAGIDTDFRCRTCHTEGEIFRQGQCARCALRNELTDQLLTHSPTHNLDAAQRLLDALCAASRPESIHTWKRSPMVRRLLDGIGDGTITASHDGLDALAPDRAIEHLRALLIAAGALPRRDPDLARFQRWLDTKLAPLPGHIAHPVGEFATWHHLHRIRSLALKGPVQASVNCAKQEITETIKFLTWVDTTCSRTAATCTQQDVDTYLADGPSTRTAIRTFFVIARKTHVNRTVLVKHRDARSSPELTEDQRLLWIRELLTGTSDTLPYRVAGMLLLLLAQPLVKIAALRTYDLDHTTRGLTIRLGPKPVPLPAPFADLIAEHAADRPNLATTYRNSPWLFPGLRAGHHLHPTTVMDRLRDLGIDLGAARNAALADLVRNAPPSLVADALGYTHQTVFRHADDSGERWSRYLGR